MDSWTVGLLLQRELAAAGHATTHAGDHLVRSSDGACFGLAHVTAACAAMPRGQWREVVADHAHRLLSSPVPVDILDTLTLEQAAAGVHLRLQPWEALPWPEVMTYAPEVAPGLVEVLMHKMGDALVQLTDDCVARLGHAALREVGLRNLIASPLGTWRPHRLSGGGQVLMVRGDSGFVASRALALPDVLRRTVGAGEEVPLPHGAVVCVPDRHTLGVHVVGHRNLFAALSWLTLLGLDDFPGAAYPLSPDLFWWREGRLTPVLDGDGAVDGELREVFEAVAGCTPEEAARRWERRRRRR